MTNLNTVTNELKSNNFPTTGSYESFPEMTYNLVIDILHFGEEVIEESTLGKGIKTLALEIAKKDGRKSVVCSETFKNILV